jgi:hypothetical protein
MFKPNFTRMAQDAGVLTISGQSDPKPPNDVLSVHVTLVQGATSDSVGVGMPGDTWDVRMAVGGFAPGPAVLVGVETRRENSTIITWAQPMEIPKENHN